MEELLRLVVLRQEVDVVDDQDVGGPEVAGSLHATRLTHSWKRSMKVEQEMKQIEASGRSARIRWQIACRRWVFPRPTPWMKYGL